MKVNIHKVEESFMCPIKVVNFLPSVGFHYTHKTAACDRHNPICGGGCEGEAWLIRSRGNNNNDDDDDEKE